MKTTLFNLIIFMILFSCSSLHGQEQNKTEWQRYEQSDKVKINDVIDSYVKKGMIKSKDDLKLVNYKKGKKNSEHFFYQQYHDDIPIEGATLNCHSVDEVIISSSSTLINFKYVKKGNLLTEKDAIEKALKATKAKKFPWDDKEYMKMLKQIKKNSEYSIYPEPHLIYYNNNSEYSLVYRIEVYTLVPTGRYYIFVDASLGTILKKEDLIHNAFDAPVNSIVNTLYHGSQELTSEETSPTLYQLIDNTRNMGTWILPDNSTTLSQASIAEDDNQNFSNINSSALTAHWAATATYDFFLSKFGMISYDNQNSPITSIVNYGNNPTTRNNAFWNGQYMVYGAGPSPLDPGTSSFSGPPVSSDIVAHEYGHAVTESTPPTGLGIRYADEAGAINESYSDIIAAAVDQYILDEGYDPGNNPGATVIQPWIIAEANANKCGNIGLRNFVDPTLNCQPKQYGGSFWTNPTPMAFNQDGNLVPYYHESNDYGGVHTNSGIMNYWFYILVTGSSSGQVVDEQGVSYIFDPIPFDDAFAIVMETYNFISIYDPDFLFMRNATVFANESLNANESYKCDYTNSIQKAWDAVHVGQGELIGECGGSFPYVLTNNPTQLCTTPIDNQDYVFNPNYYNYNYDYTWNLYHANDLSLVTTQTNTNTFTIPNFPNEGEYIVELVTSDGVENLQSQIYIYVTDCSPINNDKGVMYFGNEIGFDFRNGIAEYITYGHDNFESNICQTDSNGELLFYLAGEQGALTTNIYDKDGDIIMDNSFNPAQPIDLFPLEHSSTQIGASIKRPNNSGYKIIVNAADEGDNGLYFLDVESSNNIPVVQSSLQYISPPSNTNYATDAQGAIKVHENTIVIPGCDNTIYWIIVTTKTDDHTLIYKVDFNFNGLGDITFHDIVSGNTSTSPYQVNKDGNMLISGNKLYSFDRSSGALTFLQQYYNGPLSLSPKKIKGAFSPNGKYYYTHDYISNEIIQFNTTDFSNYQSIYYPITNNNSWVDFILGPDEKIYILVKLSSGIKFSIVNYPNNNASIDNIGFNPNFVSDNVGGGSYTFPKYIEASIPEPQIIELSIIQTSCLSIDISSDACYYNSSWDFGDGTVVPVSNTIDITSHTFSNSGTHTISLLNANGNPIATETITLGWNTNISGLEIIGPDDFCINDEPYGIFYAPQNYEYQWSVSSLSNDGSLSSTDGFFTYLSYGNDLYYDLSLTLIDENGCTETITKTIANTCPNTTNCTVDFTITEINCFTFEVTAASCVTDYNWDFGDNTMMSGVNTYTHSYTSPGTYDIVLSTYTNGILEEVTYSITVSSTCLDPCTNPTAIGSLSPGQLLTWDNSNNPVFINEEIVIPSGAILNIENTTIEFGDLGKIKVEDGAQLFVTGSTLTYSNSCTGNGWQGIQSEKSSWVQITQGSSIHRAVIGIHVFKGEDNVLFASETEFKNNGTCIFFEGGTNLEFKIYGNNFYNSPTFTTQYLIRLRDLSLSATAFSPSSFGIENNVFTNADNGIHAFKIKNGLLAIGGNSPSTENRFREVGYGIKYTNSYTSPAPEIYSDCLIMHNNFDDVNQGANIRNVPSCEIRNNTVTDAKVVGFTLIDIPERVIVSDNNLSGVYGTLSQSWSAGVIVRNIIPFYISNSINPISIVENSINNFMLGVQVKNKNTTLDNHFLEIDCNHFINNRDGIHIKNSEVNDLGSFTNPVANTFSGSILRDVRVEASVMDNYYFPNCGTTCTDYQPTMGVIGYTTLPGDWSFVPVCYSTNTCGPTSVSLPTNPSGTAYLLEDEVDYYINEEILLINEELIITNSTIHFGPNGSIRLESGATLKIIGSKLTRSPYCATGKWKGIYVEGESRIDLRFNAVTNLPSVIEHAEIGIHCKNNISNGSFVLRTVQSQFKNNLTSILIEESNTPIQFQIVDNDFTSDDNLTDVFAHIVFENMERAEPMNYNAPDYLEFLYNIRQNTFDNALYGIKTNNFKNSHLSIGGPQIGDKNTFTNMEQSSIYVRNSDAVLTEISPGYFGYQGFRGINAENNDFIDCRQGINVGKMDYVGIFKNNFTNTLQLGIKTIDALGFKILENTIAGQYPTETTWSVGMHILSSSAVNNVSIGTSSIMDNNFSGFVYGVIFKDYSTIANSLDLDCNIFENLSTGIRVNTSSITNINNLVNSFDVSYQDIGVYSNSTFGPYYYPICDLLPVDGVNECMDFIPNIFANGTNSSYDLQSVEINEFPACLPAPSARMTQEEDLNILVSPNPNNGHFIIEISGKEIQSDRASISIYNAQGQKVMETNTSNWRSDIININLSDHPAGIYMVQLTTDEIAVTKKIVITK